ncbi:MAG: hydantoinase/oxoprolinase family protein [Variibacter sp.]
MSGMRIGIDVGGTFTDLVAIDETGHTIFAKSLSTPQDQSIGVIDGLQELARRHDLTLAQLLAQTTSIVHGTTVATNALLERKGAKVALLTTQGHRDVLEMREGMKPNRYELRSSPPAPLVPRHLRFGIRERIGPGGAVLTPLDMGALDAAIADIRTSGANAVAICYLHAYKNPSHEQATEARLRTQLPEVYISRSSDVLPQIKEFERVSTTVVNSYVGPIVRLYLTNLDGRLREAGFGGNLFIVLSHGGMAPVEEAVRLAAATVLSGPAGGVAGARRCAQLLGIGDLIPFDVGGTSTDISLIYDGKAALSAERSLAGERIGLRSLDIVSIAAGGGSIAHVDAGGTFKVGPESAGAVPGPASYANGGTQPTVTDANLLLGYLDAKNFFGGRKNLDTSAAEHAVEAVAAKIGLSTQDAAAGVFRLINLNMAEGIRLMTVRRGVDPRKFALLSFGGGAGLHAVEVARELEIPRVIVPTIASVLSAWGMLTSDLRYEVSQTHVGDETAMTDEGLRSVYAALEQQAINRLRGWFDGDIRIERSAEMRYGEQVFEIDVSLDGLDWNERGLAERVAERFHLRHEELYTYSSRDQEVVFVNARVAAVGDVPAPVNEQPSQQAAPLSVETKRQARFDGWKSVPVYQIDKLAPGATIEGPAIFEAETTTVVTGAGDRVTVNGLGWLDIALRTQSSPA